MRVGFSDQATLEIVGQQFNICLLVSNSTFASIHEVALFAQLQPAAYFLLLGQHRKMLQCVVKVTEDNLIDSPLKIWFCWLSVLL